jgi:hypothetical protein
MEFLKKLAGLSSASFVPFLFSADVALSNDVNPVYTCIVPNLILLGSDRQFFSFVRFPKGVDITNVDVSSVRCEGAPALKASFHPNDRTIFFLFNIGDLREDLDSGFAVTFTVSGIFHDQTPFEGSDTVACIRKSECVVYHTSTRIGSACNACRGHSDNKIFSTEGVVTRPHRGCNCRIVQEIIYWQDYVLAFWPTSKGGSEVYDKRWGWPPPLPKGLRLRDC